MWKERLDHYVLVEATVYTVGDKWRGIWQRAPDGQPRILQETYEDAHRAMQALDEALAEGPGVTTARLLRKRLSS
jgi:hypothetical protein